MTYFKYLADLEPVEVCMMIGTCMDTVMDRLQVRQGHVTRLTCRSSWERELAEPLASRQACVLVDGCHRARPQ